MIQWARNMLALAGLLTIFASAMIMVDRGLYDVFHLGADDTDGPGQRSGLGLRLDAGTGCQWLESRFGGLAPRLGPDGRQICKGK